MGEQPDTVTVHLNVSGADDEFRRMLRRMVRVRPAVPPRRSLWLRWAGRLRRRGA